MSTAEKEMVKVKLVSTTEDCVCFDCGITFSGEVTTYTDWVYRPGLCPQCKAKADALEYNFIGNKRIRQGLKVIELNEAISRFYYSILLRLVKLFRMSK